MGSSTSGLWNQDTPYTDMEIFIGPSEFKDSANLATYSYTNLNSPPYWNVAAGQACIFVADITAALKRTGMFATPALAQSQFGTAAGQPGPSSVAGTSGPLGMSGFPPIPANKLPTLVGSTPGPVVKGIQITSVYWVYQLLTAASGFIQAGVSAFSFVNNAAPIAQGIISQNGIMSNTPGSQPLVQGMTPNVSPGGGNFLITPFTELIAVFLVTTTTGTAHFYGAVVRVNYNFA